MVGFAESTATPKRWSAVNPPASFAVTVTVTVPTATPATVTSSSVTEAVATSESDVPAS